MTADTSHSITHRLVATGLRHWLMVLLFAFGGLFASHWLREGEVWIGVRYWLYQRLHEWLPRQPYVRDTVIVLISDNEYWKGELAGRVPIRRDYLARLILALDDTRVGVIALDLDLRSPSPDGNPPEDPAYVEETSLLLSAIKKVAARRIVVLPRTIDWRDGRYLTLSDIHSSFDFGAPTPSKGTGVRVGYIALNPDVRFLPPSLQLADGSNLDSFSWAVARAHSPRLVERFPPPDQKRPLYAMFVPSEEFPTYPATELLSDSAEQRWTRVDQAIAVIGGVWSKFGYHHGGPHDSYLTPVGQIGGAYIHANYIEAILDQRIFPEVSGWFLTAVEAFLVIAVACLFTLMNGFLLRLGSTDAACLLLVAINYVALVNLGRSFFRANPFYDCNKIEITPYIHIRIKRGVFRHKSDMADSFSGIR